MRILVLVLTFFFITGCENSLCGIEEVERVSNQAGKVDFVSIHKNCGATASTATQVFIVAKGKSIKDQEPLFIAEKLNISKWNGIRLKA
ncbi:hypothetical protein [Agarivorans litoreus]|uniref:hypothetical protein n=1 Tax=Agarivorans litoreus TaxID=1510455 RepID=UPI001C7D37A4|nr:hypothetical protein [Agarivorans litoreus]